MNREAKGQNKSESGAGINFIYTKLKNLKISEKNDDINILLLGETGVGKSTFINAFFNYIKFPSLAKARNEKLQVVIASKFTVTNENYEEKIIKVGTDDNECIEIGASATQACRSYVYPIPESTVKLRLIDTPGIGDTRGIDQDNINFENILSFISNLKHLNAICILLKPNHSRLTVMFEFCVKQLLSRLDKSASQNLVFVFTNTRSTFYRPGETLPSLKKLLSTVKGVSIPCEKTNIFCTDNESFRFLAAIKNKVQFSSTDFYNFSQSWTQSCEECLRLLTYIIGDDAIKGLIPHDVKNTLSINEARRLIVQLSQPLAEIAQLIQENIRAVNTHQEHLKFTNSTLSDLKMKLYIPIINLKVKKLNQPTTVCTSSKCSTLYQVGDVKKWHYHQKCHSPCHLNNVPKEIIGSPELINCAAINSNGECVICSCRYQVHMHIYYETETFEDRLEDESIKTRITSKETALRSAQNLTLKMSTRLSKLNRERDTIIKTTAKFACFLKTNAIAPYNDAYEAYLEYLIDREKSMNEATDLEQIKQMERMLREYTEEKNAIMKAMSRSHESNSAITADEIITSIQILYALEIFGQKIKELFEVQNRARKDENKSPTQEFIFKMNLEGRNDKFHGNYHRRQFEVAFRTPNRRFTPRLSNNVQNNEQSYSHNVYAQSGSSYQQPGQSYQQPGLSYQQPGLSYRQTGPSYQQPGPSYQQPGSSYQPTRPNYQQPRQSYQQPESSYQPPRPNYQPPRQSYHQPNVNDSCNYCNCNDDLLERVELTIVPPFSNLSENYNNTRTYTNQNRGNQKNQRPFHPIPSESSISSSNYDATTRGKKQYHKHRSHSRRRRSKNKSHGGGGGYHSEPDIVRHKSGSHTGNRKHNLHDSDTSSESEDNI